MKREHREYKEVDRFITGFQTGFKKTPIIIRVNFRPFVVRVHNHVDLCFPEHSSPWSHQPDASDCQGAIGSRCECDLFSAGTVSRARRGYWGEISGSAEPD